MKHFLVGLYIRNPEIHFYRKYLSEKRDRVQVFNVIGQCFYSGRATAIRVRHNGVYIVRVAGKNYKVLVL